MKEGEQGPFSLKLRVRIKDNNSSLHGEFRRLLFPFSRKFPDLNFASYVLYIFPCGTHFEPGLPVLKCLDLAAYVLLHDYMFNEADHGISWFPRL